MARVQRVSLGGGIVLLSVIGLAGCATSPASSTQSTTGSAQPATKNTAKSNTAASNSTGQGAPAANTSSPPTSQGSTSPQFNGTITQAMRYVQKQAATMPLMAPTEPGFTPFVSYMGAVAVASADSYTVNLYSTDQQLPLNSPKLSTAQYQTAMNMIGSFGAVKYPPSIDARKQLYLNPAQSIAPAYILPPTNVSSRQVDLGHGIVGREYTSSSASTTVYTPMVLWHEGDWTLEVWDAPTIKQDVQESQNIVAYLNAHLLPETYGVFGENMAGDGNHTTAEWVYNNTLYSVFNYGSGLMAAKMAVSMRTYPTGDIRP